MPRAKRKTGQFELDLGRFELRRHGRRVKLEKKPMELLVFLLAQKEQLVANFGKSPVTGEFGRFLWHLRGSIFHQWAGALIPLGG